ncbi:DUF7848 domain-containing protein [Streptomyces pactum]|uniref:DUF7848 domain-containing protein n=1 Tax=Streptomyces pactum TaxID=68249 RepID=UPI0036F6C85B
MSRARYRFRNHTIGPDLRPEAEPHTLTMRCTTCDAAGPTAGTADPGTEWAGGHLKAHPSHLDYRETVTRPYRAVAGEWW